MRIQLPHNQLFTDPYSFQAQEHDDEVKGEGNSVNYKYRMHDPRLGRFFAVDPLSKDFPWNSSYAFCENRLLDAVELEGKEAFWIHGTKAALFGLLYEKSVNSKQLAVDDLRSIAKVFDNKTIDNTFNWAGYNSDESRELAATQLVDHIIAVRTKLIEKGKITESEPITLIGHSHGGNVEQQATNILIEKYGYKAEQFNLVALNTPLLENSVLKNADVNLYSINADFDAVQAIGSDKGKYVKKADAFVRYPDQLKKDILMGGVLTPEVQSNHNGWHPLNIKKWLPKLETIVNEKNKKDETK
jgi:RHS repeat-associated protein